MPESSPRTVVGDPRAVVVSLSITTGFRLTILRKDNENYHP